MGPGYDVWFDAADDSDDDGEWMNRRKGDKTCEHQFQWHPMSEDFGVCSICGAEA